MSDDTAGRRPADSVDEPQAPIVDVPGLTEMRLIGAGGFAHVFAARRATDGLEVAVKVARAPGEPRFAREAAALAAVGPPTCPQLIERGTTEGHHPFLVMELLVGRSFTDWSAAAPTIDDIVAHLRSLARAVDEVHRHDFIHRDLKPDNLWVRSDGTIALLDFGLARRIGERESEQPHVGLTRAGEVLGTVGYMAPEQCLGLVAGPDADRYAVAIIVFELVVGRRPFVGDVATVAHGHATLRPPSVTQLAREQGRALPAALDEVFARGLAKDPQRRFPSASALVDAFAAAIRTETTEAPARESNAAVVASKRRPIALLGLEATFAATRVAEIASEAGAVVARASGARFVLAFPDSPSAEHGLRQAIACGRRVEQLARAVVIHVAELRARNGRAGFVLVGSALERPDGWWPALVDRAPGLLLSNEAATMLGVSATRAAPQAPGFFVPAAIAESSAPGVDAPLRGRDALLQTLDSEAVASVAAGRPTLAVLTAERGHGKTRVLDALRARLSGRGVSTISLAASSPDAHDPDHMLRALARAAFGVREDVGAAEIEELARKRFGDEGDRLGAVVAWVLGLRDGTHPAVAALAGASGALQHAISRAIGGALRWKATHGGLALLLDDAQWLDPTSIDALEVATLTERGAPLWICLASVPGLFERRPLLGDRAGMTTRHELGPLGAQDARKLLLDALPSIEFVPEEIVRRILESAQGVPLYIVETARSLREQGALRSLGDSQASLLAAEAIIIADAPSQLAERVAARELQRLPREVAAFAGLCAVLGQELRLGEVASVQSELSASLDAGAIDAAAGMRALLRAGVLEHKHEDLYAFARPLVRRGIEALIDPGLRQRFHAAAVRWLSKEQASEHGNNSRLASHAAAAGDRATAARCFLELAEREQQRHRYVEAELAYTAAIGQLEGQGEAPTRLAAFRGRGQTRFRIWRLNDALTDLRAARRLAAEVGSVSGQVELLLDEATVLDWAADWDGSELALHAAEDLFANASDPRVAARLLLARGRTLFRRERLEEARGTLREVVRLVDPSTDHETAVVARLLCAPVLAFSNELVEAEQCFEELLTLCHEAGDRLHLGAAYANRILLWERVAPGRALEDLERSLEIAREIGHVQLERSSQVNLAELLYWGGELDRALSAALRAEELQRRYYERQGPEDRLLVARILTARGERGAARQVLTKLDAGGTEGWPPSARTLRRMLHLALVEQPDADADGAWEALLHEAARSAFFGDEKIEVRYVAAVTALRQGRRDFARRVCVELAQLAVASVRWAARVAVLTAETS